MPLGPTPTTIEVVYARPPCFLFVHDLRLSVHRIPLAHHRYRAVARIALFKCGPSTTYMHHHHHFQFAFCLFPNATLHSFGTQRGLFTILSISHHDILLCLPTFPGGAWSFFGILERFLWVADTTTYEGMEGSSFSTTSSYVFTTCSFGNRGLGDLFFFICIFR